MRSPQDTAIPISASASTTVHFFPLIYSFARAASSTVLTVIFSSSGIVSGRDAPCTSGGVSPSLVIKLLNSSLVNSG